MQLRIVRRSALVIGVLLTASLTPVLPASAQTSYEVTVGQLLERAPGQSMRFLPDALTVHPGDKIHFTVGLLHTATLLPEGQVPEDWLLDHAADLDDPWSFPVADPDEGPQAVKIGTPALLPSDMSCGTESNPCDFDGTGDPIGDVLNSGFAAGGPIDFWVEITADPGSTIWALCLVHTQMRMRISVVDPGQPASDPGELQERVASTIEGDTDWAVATHRRLRNAKTKHRTDDGRVVWDVYVGFDNNGVSLFAMYPTRLKVRKGQVVRFRFDNLNFENHTATFPLRRALDEAAAFATPQCDPDGDAGSTPDNPPELPNPPFCNDPSQLEIDLNPNVVQRRGDGAFNGSGYENSGERGSAFGAVDVLPYRGDSPWNLRFKKVSSRQGFGYICAIHPEMSGRVVVTD